MSSFRTDRYVGHYDTFAKPIIFQIHVIIWARDSCAIAILVLKPSWTLSGNPTSKAPRLPRNFVPNPSLSCHVCTTTSCSCHHVCMLPCGVRRLLLLIASSPSNLWACPHTFQRMIQGLRKYAYPTNLKQWCNECVCTCSVFDICFMRFI